MNVVDNLNSVLVINKPCMSSRRMSLLPRAALHSDSEQLQKGTLQNNVLQMVRGTKRYLPKWYSYRSVHLTKRDTVTKWCITEQYIIIMVWHHNELFGHLA